MDREVSASKTKERYALAALIMGAAGIAFAPIFVRLSDIDPVSSAFFRTALAMPLLLAWPYLFPAGKTGDEDLADKPESWRHALWLLLAGLFFGGDLGLWHLSIGLTSVANATLFPNLAPVYVTFVAWALFGEKITKPFLMGLVIALAGAVMVLGDSLFQGEGHIIGDLLACLTGVFYAGYILVVARLRRLYSTLTIMLWSSAGTALVLLPISLLLGEKMIPDGWMGWAVLLGLAWMSHVGGQGLIAYALAHLPVSFSSVGLLSQPVFAAVLAFWFFHEPLGIWQALGGAVILAGVYLARRGSVP